jgi:Protein of unknown function (DUF3455)
METPEMTHVIPHARLLVALVVIVAAAWPSVHAAAAEPSPPSVPDEIRVEDGNKLFLLAHAVGIQTYACNPTAGGYGWSFTGPRANLYDDNGKLVATHSRGPSWEARDGSKVVGQLVRPAPVTDWTAIPWLLLSASSTSVGPDGARLAGTTFIQRIATTGGLQPPAADCNATTAGTTSEVPYTADYAFWKRSS